MGSGSSLKAALAATFAGLEHTYWVGNDHGQLADGKIGRVGAL